MYCFPAEALIHLIHAITTTCQRALPTPGDPGSNETSTVLFMNTLVLASLATLPASDVLPKMVVRVWTLSILICGRFALVSNLLALLG